MIAQAWSDSARDLMEHVRKQMALTVKAPSTNQLKNVEYSITVRLGK